MLGGPRRGARPESRPILSRAASVGEGTRYVIFVVSLLLAIIYCYVCCFCLLFLIISVGEGARYQSFLQHILVVLCHSISCHIVYFTLLSCILLPLLSLLLLLLLCHIILGYIILFVLNSSWFSCFFVFPANGTPTPAGQLAHYIISYYIISYHIIL